MRYNRYTSSMQEDAATVSRPTLRRYVKLLTFFVMVTVIFTFCTGMSSGKAQKQYLNAVIAMDNGEYQEAIEAFEALDGYKDSEEMIKECYYLYAGQLFDEGKINAASTIFQELSGYKDADTYVEKCSDAAVYDEALRLYENEEYMSAYLAMSIMSGSYKDSEELEAKCVCAIAKQYYEDKEYKEAYNWYTMLEDCKENLPKGTDTAFTKKIPVRYAESLINTKKDDSINEGLKILKSLKSTEEIKKLISKGNKQLNQNQYDLAVGYMKAGLYQSAVEKFGELKDFSDAKKQRLAAMYEYVQENKEFGKYKNTEDLRFSVLQDTVKTFYEYAKTLSKNNYKDSKAYYKELTAWKADVFMNDGVDSVTSATSISKYDCAYAHLKLSGGPLDGKTNIKVVFTLPNGSKVNVKMDGKWEDGYSGYAYCYYEYPERGQSGTCKVKVYDGDGNVIGQSQIKMRG